MKIAVLTSDKRNWLLKGFFRQWEKHARIGNGLVEVEVAGFAKPDGLPEYATFTSIGKMEDYPVNKWSDALIKYLQGISDELVMILLEDYWMLRQVRWFDVYEAQNYMMAHREIIRFDVAADRIYNQSSRYVESVGSLDVCAAKSEYSMSFQASIWRRELLLEVLKPGETPWQSEIAGSGRLNGLPHQVVGSYQWPLNYCIVVNKGMVDTSGGWMYPARSLSSVDWLELKALGCLEETHEHA